MPLLYWKTSHLFCEGNELFLDAFHFEKAVPLGFPDFILPIIVDVEKEGKGLSMKKLNTLDAREFLTEHFWNIFIFWIWYRNRIFRCIGQCSMAQSMGILIAILLFFVIFGLLYHRKNQRNRWMALIDTGAGFGLYTVLAYMSIKKNLILVSLLAAVLVSLYFIISIFKEPEKAGYLKQKTSGQKVFRSIRASVNIFNVSLTFIVLALFLRSFYSSSLLKPSVSAENGAKSTQYTPVSCMDTLLLLFEDEWEALSVDEKMDVLQTVANIECQSFGLPHELNVGTANLSPEEYGSYSDSTHEIILNLDHVMNSPSFEMVRTVTHEAHHAYAWCLVDVYEHSPDYLRSLYFMERASVYKEEFNNYDDGEKDFEGYYFQQCERDAREYADSEVTRYLYNIYFYLDPDMEFDQWKSTVLY